MKRLNFILRVTEKCNMDCLYCYIRRESRYKNTNVMGQEIIDKLYSLIKEIKPNLVEIVWHGGEPLLWGKENYKRALENQLSIMESYPNIKIRNGIQTNGSIIDNEWIELFKKHDVSIGVSIDYPPEIHNKLRPFWNGKGSFDKVFSNLHLFLEAGFKSLSVISVLSKLNLNFIEETYRFFKNIGVDFKFNPCSPVEDTDKNQMAVLAVSPEEYGKAWVELANVYLKDNNPIIKVVDINDILTSFFTGYNSNCLFVSQCNEFFGISPFGDIYLCDLFHNKNFYIGNLLDIKPFNLVQNDVTIQLKLRSQHIEKCKNCKWFSVCNGGCFTTSYTFSNDLFREDYYCKSRKMLFECIYQTILPNVKKKGGDYDGQQQSTTISYLRP